MVDNTEQIQFNWDDIDVGNINSNHSQNFFDEKHIKHEKLDDSWENRNDQKLDDVYENENMNQEDPNEQGCIHNVQEKKDENIISTNNNNKENEQQVGNKYSDNTSALMNTKNSSLSSKQINEYAEINIVKHSPLKVLVENRINIEKPSNNYDFQNCDKGNSLESSYINIIQEQLAETTLTDENKENEQIIQKLDNIIHVNNVENNKLSVEILASTPRSSADSSISKPPRLQTKEWSIKKDILKPTGTIPKVYTVKDIYKKKRELDERVRMEEERRKREFHAKPVPDLNIFIKKIQNRQVIHHVTLPVTPEVLKRSLKHEGKSKKKMEEINQHKDEIKFHANGVTVLQQKPLIIKPKPFKLHLSERLEKRKQFDEAIHKALDEKRLQEEEERKRQEAELVKEIRKATTFKARPNPFKK